MTLNEAMLLGLIQGLTEFLPVSSSGHLVIFQHILGFDKPPVTFDVLVHVATLLAIIAVFREEIRRLNILTGKAIILGLIPTAIIGLFLNNFRDQLFGSLHLVGVALMFTTLLLASSKFIRISKVKYLKRISYKTALVIGIAQGIAVIPGISRSGATIISGLWAGLDKKTAIAFSFLLSIPAVIGAQILEMTDPVNANQINFEAYLIGFFAAAISGWLSLKILKNIIHQSKLHLFAFYTFVLSLFILFS
jgi:undecaprenyl-diphosphatase